MCSVVEAYSVAPRNALCGSIMLNGPIIGVHPKIIHYLVHNALESHPDSKANALPLSFVSRLFQPHSSNQH